MFFLLCVSDADMNTATSFIPAAIAASSPWRLGTSAEYTSPGLRTIRRDTSPPSASCGIHFGLTKLVISMARSPVSDSASMSFTLSSVGTMRDSFCRPSRGPTSYSVTSGGSCSNTAANFTTRVTRRRAAPRRAGASSATLGRSMSKRSRVRA